MKESKKNAIIYRHITYVEGDIFVSNATINTTPVTGIHFHNGWELILITRGKYKFYAPNMIYDGSGPCIGMFRLGTYHGVHFTDCETVSANRYVINFTKELIEKIPSHMNDAQSFLDNDVVIIPLNDENFKELSFMFERLDKLHWQQIKMQHQKKISAQIYGYMTVILNTISDIYLHEASIVSNKGNDGENNYVYAIIREMLYAVEHNESVSAATLAEKFFVSRSKLSEDFRSITGLSVKQMIDVLKLERIKNLLGNDISNREIIEKFDFSSESYFVQFFKKHTGLTPGDYRRLNVQDSE